MWNSKFRFVERRRQKCWLEKFQVRKPSHHVRAATMCTALLHSISFVSYSQFSAFLFIRASWLGTTFCAYGKVGPVSLRFIYVSGSLVCLLLYPAGPFFSFHSSISFKFFVRILFLEMISVPRNSKVGLHFSIFFYIGFIYNKDICIFYLLLNSTL
jgi:hypothetical protein